MTKVSIIGMIGCRGHPASDWTFKKLTTNLVLLLTSTVKFQIRARSSSNFAISVITNFVVNSTKECVEDPVANGLSLTNQILYIKKL